MQYIQFIGVGVSDTQHRADTDKVLHNIRAVSASELSYPGNADHRPNLLRESLGI